MILKEVPRLITRDEEIREFIIKLSSKHFADKKKTEDRFNKILDELRKDRERIIKNEKRIRGILRGLKGMRDGRRFKGL